MSTIKIKVADRCDACVTRLKGEELRQSLMSEFEKLDNSSYLQIDFGGVSMMTPSFADECFGKLAQSLGKPTFRSSLRLGGASQSIKALVNTVISQRLSLT